MTVAQKLRKAFIKILKVGGWITLSVVALLIILILVIRIPAVQRKIVQKAVTFLQDKIGTPVSLKALKLSFPKKIVLEDLYLQDQRKDTLLFASELVVNVDMLGLLQNSVDLKSVSLSGTNAFIYRSKEDSTYNFDYIVDAFASTGPVNTTASPWKFYLGLVELEKIKFLYRDSVAGDNASFNVGTLAVNMDQFDLDKSIFKAGAIKLTDSQVKINQNFVSPSNTTTQPDTTTSSLPDISFQDLQIEQVDFVLSENYLEVIRLSLGELNIKSKKIDISENIIDLEAVDMEKSFISFKQQPSLVSSDEKKVEPISSPSSFPLDVGWDVKIEEVNLRNNTFKYDNVMSRYQPSAIDFNHLLLSSINVTAKDIHLARNSASAEIRNLSFHEKSGFSITSLSSSVLMTDNKLEVKDFLFASDRSSIDMNMKASFSSFSQLTDHLNQVRFELNLKKANISVTDVKAIIPHVVDSIPLIIPSDMKLGIAAIAQGTIGDLTLRKISVKALDSTALETSGTLVGLPDINKTIFNISIDRFYTTSSDLRKILADSLLPDSMKLPRWAEIKAKWKGTLTAPEARVAMRSSAGDVAVAGKFDFNLVPRYDASIKVKELNVGEILNDKETYGTLTLSGDVKGSGQNLDDLNAVVNLVVQDFEYHQYDYKNLKVNGSIGKKFFSGTASLQDENLDFNLNGEIDRNKDIPSYALVFNLNNADFKALHLSSTTLKARGTAVMNLNTNNFKSINGSLHVRNVAIYNGKEIYKIDSLLFESVDKKDSSSFSIQSDIVAGNFKANFNLFDLPLVIKQHVNQFFPLQDAKIAAFKENKHFAFDFTIRNTDILTKLVFPDLKKLTPGKIAGEFDSDEQTLAMDVNFSEVKYSGVGLDSIALKIRSNKKALNYSLRLKKIKMDTLRIDQLEVSGKIAHDSINTKISILDSLAKEKYVFGGVFRSQENKFKFHFIQNQVMLNYETWKVPDDNYLQFGHSGIVANNFSISKDRERIELITDTKDQTISLEFQQLQLSQLTNIAAGIVPATGIIDGNFRVTTAKQGEFGSKLAVHDLVISKKNLGEITLGLQHSDDQYHVALSQKSEASDVEITGTYTSKLPAAEFDLNVNLKPMNMELIEPLFGQLKKVKGQMFGSLKLTGTARQPSIRGDINFKDASFTLKQFGSAFTLKDEKISFQESGIAFNNFTLLDSANHQATIRGNILTKAYKDFEFDLRVNTQEFQLLNSTADDSDLYYGKVKATADVKIVGDSQEPVISMKVSLSDDSQLTYVVPESEKTVMAKEGIVRFVDRDAVVDPFLKDVAQKDSVKDTDIFKGLDLTATIELTDREILNIVIDPITGDKLSVQGNSTLLLEIKANGEINLSGRYEITKGSYDFSFYKLVKRQFAIEKGGSITWTGDPLKAILDIKASYLVNTTPLELLAPSGGLTISNADANTYRQQLPFFVYLNIKGQILKPEISFALDMPENKRGVFGGALYSKLQDINTRESDLNKQVFALLILKRFIADNPLDNGPSAGVADATRQSVSRILSDQLNRLGENVKGVQLNLDIKSYEDFSSGAAQGQTRVQLGVQKNLLNDRLVIKLSGNVDVEGQNTNSTASDYIGDLALEYKLTPDGRLRITGFRTSNYDMISGELTETGTGLIYIKDYNTLKELFRSNDKKTK